MKQQRSELLTSTSLAPLQSAATLACSGAFYLLNFKLAEPAERVAEWIGRHTVKTGKFLFEGEKLPMQSTHKDQR